MTERPALLMERKGSFLIAHAPFDSELLAEYPQHTPFKVDIKRARRSLQHNRLYFSMLKLVTENLDQPVTKEALHEWIKLRTGVTAAIPLKSGKVDIVAGSTAFDSMDQAAFNAFFEQAVALILEHIIPGLGAPELEREARLMLGEAA